MKLKAKFGRIRSLLTFRKIRKAIGYGDLQSAIVLLEDLDKQVWNPIVFTISSADVDYGLGKYKQAKAGFEDAMRMAETEYQTLGPDDLRYLVAYSDFRRLSLDYLIEGTDFHNWKDVAKTVMSLPAKGILKKNIFISFD